MRSVRPQAYFPAAWLDRTLPTCESVNGSSLGYVAGNFIFFLQLGVDPINQSLIVGTSDSTNATFNFEIFVPFPTQPSCAYAESLLHP